MTKILIDAGMSQKGWSRIGSFCKCPQLYAYQRILGIKLIPADALTRGTMGHVLLAHQHAIWGAEEGGVWVDEKYHEDPSVFFSPEDAVVEWCDQNGGHEHLDRMIGTFNNYMTYYPERPGRSVAVEYPVSAILGYVDGVWGLWVESTLGSGVTPKEKTIEVTPLDVPGHDDHGKPVRLTRRLDLVVEDRLGRTYVWDHKNQARVQPNRSVDAYAIDGGFAAFRIMGRQLYENFGGVTLNLLQTTEPFKAARPSVPPTPHRDSHFAEMLWHYEHELARLEVSGMDPWKWPKTMHETACYGRYGPCSGIKLCFFGERGLDILSRRG